MAADTGPSTKLVKPKTHRGRRELERRAPKTVEEPKRALLLYGNRTSALLKEALTDLHKLKWGDAIKYSRKNEEVRPFEAGGEAALERYCAKGDCALFALGGHSKKRPHCLTLGRMYDGHLYDALELSVQQYRSIQAHGGAAAARVGAKPCFVFAGDGFETEPKLMLARSLLLDWFRGREVSSVNLAGLDRVVFVTHVADSALLLRQYRVAFKKSGTRVPRVVLTEMGPSLDCLLGRAREAPPDLAREALKRVKEAAKKKEKNVSSDLLAGKVGRIYMPQQDVASMALKKPKGLKRERREAAAATAQKKARAAVGAAAEER